MADLQKTVEIIFGAVDNTGGTISNVSNNVESFADGVSTVTGPLSDFADLALKTEASVVALGVAMLGVAVNESAKLSSSINEIGTLFNATPDQVDAMKASIKSYATDSVFSFEDITKATYDMVSATGDAEGAVDALGVAEKAAVVGATDLGTSVDALTTILNAYGLGLESSNDVMGAFIVAVQNGKTTLPELSEAIGRVASTASAAEVPFDDLLAAVAALTAGGVKTAESMTLLQSLLKELVDPSDELITALGGMSLETNSLQEVMQQLQRATGGSFEEMNQLFGSIEATKGAIILAADSSGTFERALEGMGNKANVVAQNFDLMKDNLDLVIQNMQNNLRATLESIGNELLPEWTNIVQAISDIFKGVDVGLDNSNFEAVFKALNEVQSAVATYAEGIAKALPDAMKGLDFTGLLDAFGDLGQAVGDIFGDLDLTNADDLREALQFIIDSAETLTHVVTGIAESWKPTIEQIKLFVDEVNNAGTDSQQLAGFISGLGQQFELFKGLLTGSAEALDVAGTALTVIAGSSVANTLTNMAGSAGTLTTALGKAGLAGAAYAAALAVGYQAGEGLNWAVGRLFDRTGSSTLGTLIYDLFHSGEEAQTASVKVDEFTGSVDELNKKAGQPKTIEVKTELPVEEVRDYTQIVNELDKETIQLQEGQQELQNQMKGLGLVYREVTDESGKLVGQWVKQDAGASDAAAAAKDYVTTMEGGVPVFTQTSESLKKANTEITKSGEEADKSKDKLSELEKTMLELASNERIAAMEFTAEIKVADIQAQAQQVEAAFDSVARSVEATSSATADLFSLLADPNLSLRDKFNITDAAEQQLELQEKALEIQEDLVDAQIRVMDAQAEALNRGDQEIKISADGLAPEIEAFMFEILKRIRLEVSADYGAFLNGVVA